MLLSREGYHLTLFLTDPSADDINFCSIVRIWLGMVLNLPIES